MPLVVLRLHIPPAEPPRRANTGHLWDEARGYEAYRTRALGWLPQMLFDSIFTLRILAVADTQYSVVLARDAEYYPREVPEEDWRDTPIREWRWWIAMRRDGEGVKLESISAEEGERELVRLGISTSSDKN